MQWLRPAVRLGKEAPVTSGLVALNLVIFLLQVFDVALSGGRMTEALGLRRDGLETGQFWLLFTHLFLHSPDLWFHILFNMVALWFAGREVEYDLGAKRYLFIYFTGGIVGGLLQVYAGTPNTLLIGASGSIFAILLAFTTVHANTVITALLFFIIPLRVRGRYLGMGLIIASLALWILGLDAQFGHLAHLGGAFTGYLICRFWGYGNRTWLERRLRLGSDRPGGVEMLYPGRGRDERMDKILDKVSKDGFQSLTPEERSALDRWMR